MPDTHSFQVASSDFWTGKEVGRKLLKRTDGGVTEFIATTP